MINGVKVKELNSIKDDRGFLMEIFRVSEEKLQPRQVYITTAKENVIKDKDKFHMHEKQIDNFTCIKGKIKLVLVDIREDSSTKDEVNEFLIGEENYKMVRIPRKVLHAFQSLNGESIVLNCVDNEYNKEEPDEHRIENKYYDWDKGKSTVGK